MQDQIAELAARLTSAATKAEIEAVDMAIYHARRLMRQQHELTLNLMLAQVATLKSLHDADDDKLHALGEQAEKMLESLGPKQEEAA